MDSMDNKKEETLYLYTGANQSAFVNKNESKRQEILEEAERQMQANRIDVKTLGTTTSFFDIFIYKFPEEDMVYGGWVTSAFSSPEYFYHETTVPLEWKITEEQKEFEGYVVQKATTSFAGREYEAWFTLEISIPDGPYVFSGLPGLIVELYDTEKHYHFELEGVEKLETSRVFEIDITNVLEKSEFKKSKRD